jgi:DNA invertase Pin-like site-specific DNA recombinase
MVAAYIRVSSKAQSFSSQKTAIEKAARARGDEITAVFEEKAGGEKSTRKARPVFAALREAVRRGEHSRVYVFSLDRLSRGGITDLLTVVDEFHRAGCEIVSLVDGFDLQGPAAPVVLAVMAWAAQFERKRIGERIAAARARVEAEGGQWGRRRALAPEVVQEARRLVEGGASVRRAAALLGVSRATLGAALANKHGYSKEVFHRRKAPVAGGGQ